MDNKCCRSQVILWCNVAKCRSLITHNQDHPFQYIALGQRHDSFSAPNYSHLVEMISHFDVFLLPFNFGFSTLCCICVQQCLNCIGLPPFTRFLCLYFFGFVSIFFFFNHKFLALLYQNSSDGLILCLELVDYVFMYLWKVCWKQSSNQLIKWENLVMAVMCSRSTSVVFVVFCIDSMLFYHTQIMWASIYFASAFSWHQILAFSFLQCALARMHPSSWMFIPFLAHFVLQSKSTLENFSTCFLIVVTPPPPKKTPTYSIIVIEKKRFT